jgi:hypothetical protein
VARSDPGGSAIIRFFATIRTLTSALVTIALVLPGTAAADVRWARRGTDPSDITCAPVTGDPCLGFDVASTSVRITRRHDGRRWIVLVLRAHSRPLDGWTSRIALDTRGGTHLDHRAFLNNPLNAAQPQRKRCEIRRAAPDGENRRGRYTVRRQGRIAKCRFPLRWVAPDKRPIRWHVTTDWIFPEVIRTRDRAPNHGWYPSRT